MTAFDNSLFKTFEKSVLDFQKQNLQNDAFYVNLGKFVQIWKNLGSSGDSVVLEMVVLKVYLKTI